MWTLLSPATPWRHWAMTINEAVLKTATQVCEVERGEVPRWLTATAGD